MNAEKNFDIAIIGLGPAGATLARLLDSKFSVIAFDKKTLSLVWVKEDIIPTNRKPFYKDFASYQQEQKFIHTR